MDRRQTLQWMLAASAALVAEVSAGATPARKSGKGYGTDPKLNKTYRGGELWPLTCTAEQSRTAQALCGLIIPADDH